MCLEVPRFLKDIFIHKRIAVKALKCSPKSDKVLSSILKGILYPLIHVSDIAHKCGIPTKVTEVAPDIRHTVIFVGLLPHLMPFAKIVKQQ